MVKLNHATVAALKQSLQDRETTTAELLTAFKQRIKQTEPSVQAYITQTMALAEQQASEAELCLNRGNASGLTGIPGIISDNICVEGVKTTCASKILADFISPYSATAVQKLVTGGAVVLGKANLDEFAMGTSTETSAFCTSRNPWDLDCIPGGACGGAAAAVAAGAAAWALTSDTGGDTRQPAAYCGVVGFKPTYGRVSRYGLIAHASSLDQIGIMTHDVADCAMLLNKIAGHDGIDATAIAAVVPDYTAALTSDLAGLTIGLPRQYFALTMDPEVGQAVAAVVNQLEAAGAIIKEVSLPYSEYALAVYQLIAAAEGSSNLARYDGMNFGFRGEGDDLSRMYTNSRTQGFGAEVMRRIVLGTYMISAGQYQDYLQALKVRTLIKRDFVQVFDEVDLLLTPTTPRPAARSGQAGAELFSLNQELVYTVAANLAGLPAISVPCGFSGGLPIGVQFIGRPLDESVVLKAAYAYQQRSEFRSTRSPLGGETL